MKLGVNKTSEKASINKGAGIRLLKHVGDEVKKGDLLAYLFTPKNVKFTKEDFSCFNIS